MGKSALVTGGAGFIGSHLVERLVAEGWRVRVLDNVSTGSWRNLDRVRDRVEVLPGDIRDRPACAEACVGVETVFHMAAIASVPGSIQDPETTHAVNVNGTLSVLLAARAAGVRRFVFASSAAVYGNTETVPVDEDQPLRPESPYATSKAAAEFYCRNFWELYGLETVVLRYFNVFGPRQSPVSGYAAVIPRFVSATLRRQAPVVYGDGRQTRDFVYVEDVAAANLRAATADSAAGRTFNVGGGRGISLLCLISELERVVGAPLCPEFHPARAGEVRHSLADITRAGSTLGFRPLTSLDVGLRRTLEAATDGREQLLAAAG